MRRIVGEVLDEAVLVDAGGLCATADQGVLGSNQHVVGRHRRVGHLVDDDLLQSSAYHLLHACSVSASGRRVARPERRTAPGIREIARARSSAQTDPPALHLGSLGRALSRSISRARRWWGRSMRAASLVGPSRNAARIAVAEYPLPRYRR